MKYAHVSLVNPLDVDAYSSAISNLEHYVVAITRTNEKRTIISIEDYLGALV